tara:strand:- start:2063 stop:3337 length:1275 start_codon:yes stop_codon:yes gene_type:complete
MARVKDFKRIPYGMAEIFNPRAKNGMSSRDAFDERKKYKNVPYFIDLPDPLKSWYNKLYFGRVDMIQNGVIIKKNTSNLKQIKTDSGNVFVLNFVADAFEDLNNHLRRVIDAGYITSDSVYAQLDPIAGLVDYVPSMRNIHSGWQTRFAARLNSKRELTNRVRDLKSYIAELFSYMDAGVNYMPLTLTGYVVSNYSSPMISGLSFELQTDNYGTDAIKFTKYILDPNFRYFVKAARKYGFYVDRNGPWKITADPLSTPMLNYMSEYVNISSTFPGASFFTHYYHRTYTQDYAELKKTLRLMYNQYATDFPRITIETTRSTRCFEGAQEEVKFRGTATEDAADALGESYWMDVYFKIRLKEAALTMSDYENKYNMALQIKKTYDLERALRYINNEIKPYLYDLRLEGKPLTEARGSVKIGSVRDT